MAEMTEEQMRKLMESDADRTTGFTPEQMDEMQRAIDEQDKREEEETKEEFSPGLEEDRTAPLREEPVEEKPEGRQASDQLVGEFVASLMGDKKEEPTVMAAEGGSIEREADFVKDDDEEPNDPPPGATPEEVADDVPAYLSTGEYVLPANVVRYLGLERIVSMHKGALAALQQMEDLDIIENVDENGMVEEDDDEMDYLKEPKGVVKTTLVVAKPHPSGMMAMPFQFGGGVEPAPGSETYEAAEEEREDLQKSEDEAALRGGYSGVGPDKAYDTKADAASVPSGVEGFFSDMFGKFSPGDVEDPAEVFAPTEKQIDQYMFGAESVGKKMTREQAIEDLSAFNRSVSTQSALSAGLSVGGGLPGKLAALGTGLVGLMAGKGVTVTPSFEEPDPGGDADDTDPIALQAAQDETKDTAKKLIEELEESKGGKRYKVDPVEALRFGQLGEEYTRGSFFQR